MPLRRRPLLAAPLALLAARALADVSASSPAIGERPFGRHALSLPVIGLGTWQSFDIPARGADADEAAQALRTLLDGGARVVDTSPMYGLAEAALGEISARVAGAERLFVATKVWTHGRAAGERALRSSRTLLRRERLDLVQVHNLLDIDAHWPALEAARERGDVRFLGLTHYTASAHEALRAAMARPGVDAIQVNYSLAEPEAAARLLPEAADRGIAVLVNRPFAEGAMFARVRGRALPRVAAELGASSVAQLLLKWILANPAVTCALTGTRNPRHVADNLAAARGPLPDAAQRRAIEAWWSE